MATKRVAKVVIKVILNDYWSRVKRKSGAKREKFAMMRDRYGNALTTGSAGARDAYVMGCDLLLSAQPGGAAALRAAIAADDGFLMGHVGLARALQGEGQMAAARASLEGARGLLAGATARERSQFDIHARMLGGDGAGALAEIRAHVAEWPRDAMALAPATGVFGLIGFSGLAGRERAHLDLLEPLAGQFGDDWWFLGALAFAEIEQGELGRGRVHVDRALALHPGNANAAHVSAHGHYEAGEAAAGRALLGGWLSGYPRDAVLHSHLSWHLALWAIQRGDMDEAWAIYHGQLRPGMCTGPAINQVSDGASFLFRVGMAGAGSAVDGALWGEVSDATSRLFPVAGVAFIDLHAGLAHAMAGDGERLARLMEGVRGPAGDLVVVASRGFAAFARGDWEGVVAELGAVMGEHERFGGSRAQRDLLEFAMACGLMRVGRGEEAKGVLGRVSGRG